MLKLIIAFLAVFLSLFAISYHVSSLLRLKKKTQLDYILLIFYIFVLIIFITIGIYTLYNILY